MTQREKGFIDDRFASETERSAAYERLEHGEPLAYIIGEWYFWLGTFRLNKSCLIPRPDTELLVEAAVKLIPRGAKFADLGTGSGCIAVSVLMSRPDLTADAFDISPDACRMASENAALNGVAERMRVVCADMTARDFAERYNGYDAILSNPPYIAAPVIPTLSEQVKAEPIAALDGGGDGLRFYRVITELRRKMLNPGGLTALEIGYDQAEAVTALLGGGKIIKDYGGNDRVIVV